VLAAFRKGEVRILIATDIAARGIDVDGISHIVNFDLPNVPETYVHRIGRTARAGADGIAISLCGAEEVAFLRAIEKLIRIAIPAESRRTLSSKNPPSAAPSREAHASPNGRGNQAPVQRHRAQRGQGRHPQAREANGGVAAVGFLDRDGNHRRNNVQRAPR
jgi:superfamily II DNA/RNA helicase